MTRAVQIAELGDQNVFTVDGDNSRIGIGTTNPQALLQVGTGVSVYGNSGIVSATTYYGSGAELTGITGGATLSAASGSQRVVVTSLTSGSMTAAGTDADFAWNSTTNTLSATNISVSGTLTYEDVTNVDSVGIVTARSGLRVVGGGLTVTGVSTFFGKTRILDDVEFHVGTNGVSGDYKFYHDSGNSYNILYEDITGREARFISNLSGESNANFHFFKASTALARFSVNSVQLHSGGAVKFETTAAGVNVTGIVTATGSVQVGSGQSFGSSGASAAVYYGDGSNLTNLPAAGLTTEAFTSSGIVTAVRLSTAQDHKITATGFTTITSSGSGTEGESHTIRIVNSGIATVGFSTYFLFPSGAAPSLPTADGAISLISFTVHDSVGAGCTQLLAGASVNFS